MSHRNLGILFVILSLSFVVGTIAGCVGRAEAVLAYNPGAPV